jgi:hypothetical protein
MAYTPQIVTEEKVRDFFNPKLTEEEYASKQLLAKIQAVEYSVNSQYSVALSDSDEKIVQAVIMLIASKIGSETKVLQKRTALSRENWVTEKMQEGSSDPYRITRSWAKEAKMMLRQYLPNAFKVKKVDYS